MSSEMSLGFVRAEKSTDTHLLPFHVTEAFQDVFSQRSFNGLGDFGVFPDQPRQDIVIGDAVLDLFHQSDRLAVDDLT